MTMLLTTLTLATQAQAQECDSGPDASVFYADVDGSGKVDEISLSTDGVGDVTLDVAFDVAVTVKETTGSDKSLGLEIKDLDGDKVDDLSLVVDGKTVGLVDVDWASLAKQACGGGDSDPDVHVSYRQGPAGPDVQIGPMYCWDHCWHWETVNGKRVCTERSYICTHVGWDKF